MKPLMICATIAGLMFIESYTIRLAEKNNSPAVYKIPLRRNRSALQRRAASKTAYEVLSNVYNSLNFSVQKSHNDKFRWPIGL